ncbi:hypothetical protein [Bacteroides sp. 224]|uniref:hypothetical protein n=1 Tax=Bacteroides sp. 224 TaxID=2302936 RepID=UPI0013D0E17B|nr:hypothetical protein [Bacteroides sp. 224]NDV65342.1 hypothetical protein [Bacteroides sp. 224]
MKTIKYILSASILLGSIFACSDDWDSYYSKKEQVINNDNITVVESSLIEYLKTESGLNSTYQLFESTGVFETMNKKDQLFTLLVSRGAVGTLDDVAYMAKSHVSDIALSPANLYDGQRVLMWNGKYLNVAVEESELKEKTYYFNGIKVKQITKAANGWIYELESFVSSPKSMYEVIKDLGEDYSLFREMVLSKEELIFDKNASIPIGVDNTGNTVYDSIFVVTNPYFTSKGFDLTSESLTATMLIPSNEVVQKAQNDAWKKLGDWKLLTTDALKARADTVIDNWIFQSAFFKVKYTEQDFTEKEDLSSIFDKQWRTTVQEVDFTRPLTMSNGVAYYVKSMKIPTNVLIYRLKDYMRWYEHLTEADKGKYFSSDNLEFVDAKTDVAAWSGWPGVFPLIENRVINFNLADKTKAEYTMDFVPFQYIGNNDGSYTATPYMIPPGEYDLCLGFKQKLGHDVEVSFNGKKVTTITTSQLTSTTYHYDRGGQGYPEGYDTTKATDKKKGNYDRDGGKTGVVTIEGTEPVEVTITFRGVMGTVTKTMFHHWCLKPTKNCY